MGMAMKTLRIYAKDFLAKIRIFFQVRKNVREWIMIGTRGTGMAALGRGVGRFGNKAVILALKGVGR
jgi:hypothetical protein